MTGRWQTASVFISSTFRDMHSERDILIKKVFPDIRARLLPYRIRLIDIDLRWGITREEAENEKTIDFCLDSINDCRPLFLGILGERYGWIPAPYPESITRRFPELVKDGQTSITALEVIHGVLSDKNENAAFLFRDPLFESAVPAGFNQIVRAESPAHEQKQKKLKDLIRNEKLICPVVENYPCAFKGIRVDWELMAGEAPEAVASFMQTYSKKGLIEKDDINQASAEVMDWLHEHATLVLDQLDVFVEEVQQALWKMLCHAFPVLNEATTFEDKPEELEDDEHQRVLDEHLVTFVGRDSLREEFIQGKGGSLIAITGASGRGKTATLAALVSDWKKRYPNGDAVFHFVGATSSGRRAEGLFSRLLRLVSRSAGREVPGAPSKDSLPNALRKLIEDFPTDKKLLIALDDLDYVFKAEGFDLRWLPEEIPSNVSILLSVFEDKAWSENNLRQLAKAGAELIALPALREAERKEIIRKIPSLWAKTLDDSQIDLLSNHPGTNNPLYLTIALEELRKFGSFERLEKRIEKFPHLTGVEGLILLYEQLLGRLERELDREVVNKALGLLASSLTGLREEEIIRLCPDIDPENLAQLWRELRTHIHFDQGMLSFYHETLKLTVQKRYLGRPQDKRSFHRQLADFFENQSDKERSLAELLEHYHELGETEAIRSLLSQLENYVIMRHSYPNWLNTNWNRIEETNPLALLHKSLCENLGAYEDVLNHEDGIPLNYWQVSEQGSTIKLYDEENDRFIRPVLADWQHDLLIELSRTVDESILMGEYQLYLSVKCLAILEAELGAVHARTLEALSVALPMLAGQLSEEGAREYYTRAFMMAMSYLPEHHPVCLSIRMHTQDFLRRTDPEQNFVSDFEELSRAYVSTGSCENLRELERDALIREDQRIEFFANLLTRHSLMLREAGEIQASFEFCQKAVSFCDRELGPVHEYAILARNNLALHYFNLTTDHESGRKILEETMSFSGSRVGSYSYIGLLLLNNLSTSMGNAGKFEEALPIYRETVDRKKEMFGLRNASTLHSINNLSFCYRNMARFDEALKLNRQAIAGFEALGSDYKSDLIRLKLSEIEIIEESGDPSLAHSMFKPLYQHFMQNFDGKDWLSYYLLNSKQASMFRDQNRLEEAAELYELTFRILHSFGSASKQIDRVFNELMEVLKQILNASDKGDLPEHRLVVLERIIRTCQDLLPGGDPRLFHWQSEYGETLLEAGRLAEAESLLRACVQNLTASKGSDDPDTRIASARLSRCLLSLENEDEAANLLSKSIEASGSRENDMVSVTNRHLREIENKYGPDHPTTIENMHESAKFLIVKKHQQEALSLLTDAYERSEKAYGMLADQSLSIARNQAELYMHFEEYAKAEVILRRVANAYERKEGLKHEPTLETLAALGDALMAINESSEALALFQKALEACQTVYGRLAPQTMNSLIHLSRLYQKVENEKEFSRSYAEYMERITTLRNTEQVKEIFLQCQEQKEKDRIERIERNLTYLKNMLKMEETSSPGGDEEELWKQAESMSESDLNPEKPEGSGKLLQWLDHLLSLIPEKHTVDLWEGFCSDFEALCEPADPLKYLPRFKFALWILRHEGTGEALDQLSAIWQEGELQSHYVQEAAFLILETLVKNYKPEDVIPVAQNMAGNFIELLGAGHPRTHFFINETAGYLLKNKEYALAREKFSFLFEQTEGILDKDHPFVQNILQKLEAIDQKNS